MKKAFVIPGFRESPATKGYKEIASLLRKKGYDPTVVRMRWNNRTMSDYVSDFRNMARNNEGAVLLGFSFGAIVALCAAADAKPEKLFLCSLSPYFKEDLKGIPVSWKRAMGKRRIEDFAGLSCVRLAEAIDCPTYLFLGEAESEQFPTLKRRVEDASRRIKKASLVFVPEAPHDVGHPAYQQAVARLIDQVL